MTASDASLTTRRPRRSPLLFVPLAVFALLAGLFLVRLSAGDPSRLPSALIGRPAPPFTLPPVPGLDVPGLASGDLGAGHVTLVNVFASWCVECHVEHEALLQLASDAGLKDEGVVIDGIAYKDKAEDARRYLGAKGNPFRAVGNDAAGRTAIDFGVYGVPETFLIKGDGTIAYKLIGGITADTIGTLRAEIEKAR